MKTFKYIGILLALVVFNQILSITTSIPQTVYYVLIAAVLLTGLVFSRDVKINGLMGWLIFSAVLSLIVNTVPDFFQAPFRLVTFTMVIALIGPLLSSYSLNSIKEIIFSTLNYLILIFASLSFLIYSLKLPIPQHFGFSGFFNHSMMLGPIAAIALFSSLHMLFESKKAAVSRIKKQIIYVAIIFCFLSLLLAASRAAIAGAVTGGLFFFYKNYQHRVPKLVSILSVMIMLILVTYPAWSDYTKGIQIKQKNAESNGDFASSRRLHWMARFNEFKQSPVIGIGFASLGKNKRGSNVQKNTGGIEPGSSWLAILSMTGLLGFIPVFLLFKRYLEFLIRDHSDPLKSAMFGGLLIFFITHMFAEGYVFASGGFLFFYLWLLLGVIEIFLQKSTLKSK